MKDSVTQVLGGGQSCFGVQSHDVGVQSHDVGVQSHDVGVQSGYSRGTVA